MHDGRLCQNFGRKSWSLVNGPDIGVMSKKDGICSGFQGILGWVLSSELSKGLVLDGGRHVHIRHITPSPLVNVGYYNPPSLGA
ncbi:glutamate receptor 2.2 [Prunus dulcis]|uniref:Glutamate receptor 2.2 n=1 Tax=Prunus dulcis TaxID=3755 RepID=A0A4Y1RN97_PRUDU|nr:glutamate receptor 2.2 [Prunus dulcis]